MPWVKTDTRFRDLHDTDETSRRLASTTATSNIGLGLATGDYIAVVNNDCCLAEGDVYDLCVPETVTSPTADRAGGQGQGAGLLHDLARSPGVRHHR